MVHYTYREFLEDINEDFVRLCLLGIELLDGLLNRCRSDSARFENLRAPTCLLSLGLGLKQDGLVYDELADVFCGDELGVTIVDHFVNNLID